MIVKKRDLNESDAGDPGAAYLARQLTVRKNTDDQCVSLSENSKFICELTSHSLIFTARLYFNHSFKTEMYKIHSEDRYNVILEQLMFPNSLKHVKNFR